MSFLMGLFQVSNMVLAKMEQIHISQGHTPSSMTISWVTKHKSVASLKYKKYVDTEYTSVYGYTSQYNFTYPSLDLYNSGYIHHVSIIGLHENTKYNYVLFDKLETSEILEFKTLPKIGSLNEPLVFGVVGDLGQTSDSLRTLGNMMRISGLNMVLHAGDLSYADCKQPLWDHFGNMIQPLAKSIPWMVGPGNHEIEFTTNGNLYLAFEERYKMPQIKSAEMGDIIIPPATMANGNPYCCPSIFQSVYDYGNAYFSYDAGMAHIIYLNPYSVSEKGSKQWMWLEMDLLRVDRKTTPWVIVVMHGPWYNSNKAHHDEKQTVMMRDAMEDLFYDYGVDIAFTGHVHAYERTYPVYRNEVNEKGTIYIVIGDGGNIEGHASSYYDQPAWSAFRNGNIYGHGVLTLTQSTLRWVWIGNHKDSSSETLSFIVDKTEKKRM